MNTNSFVKNFFFKNENNGLTISSFRVVLVAILIITIVFSVYQFFSWYVVTPFLIVRDLLIAFILTVPAYAMTRLFGREESTLSNIGKSDIQTISIILAIAVATVLILANILLKQSQYIGAIVLAAIVGASVYFIGNKYLSVGPLPAGVTQKSHNLIFLIGWILAFSVPILGIIVGIYLYTRKDNQYSKVHGLILVVLGIIVWFVSFYATSLFGYY